MATDYDLFCRFSFRIVNSFSYSSDSNLREKIKVEKDIEKKVKIKLSQTTDELIILGRSKLK